jgi:hypothetical protein
MRNVGVDELLLGARPPAGSEPLGSEWVEVLRGIPLFAGLSKRHVKRIANLARPRRFVANSAMVRKGERGGNFLRHPRRRGDAQTADRKERCAWRGRLLRRARAPGRRPPHGHDPCQGSSPHDGDRATTLPQARQGRLRASSGFAQGHGRAPARGRPGTRLLSASGAPTEREWGTLTAART